MASGLYNGCTLKGSRIMGLHMTQPSSRIDALKPDTPVKQVVVIGTSTGGISALRELLGQLPSNLPAAVFVTMHIGDHASLLPNFLAKATPLEVRFALPEERIRNGHVYVAPPDRHLLVEQGRLRLVRSAKENHSRPAIDPMFRSAAISYGNRAIGVLLTGELDDGVIGLQAIKAYGGVALVQDPETAPAPSMPESALRHVEVNACLPPEGLGRLLAQTVEQRRMQPPSAGESKRIEPFATENDLTYDLSAGGAQALSSIGAVSGISCPECGGGLWELGLSPPRFRCHTGHSYTSSTLLRCQDASVEEALWVAVRALHEKQLLIGRLAQSSKEAGRNSALEEYELADQELESHKAALKALITRLRPQ